VSLHDATCALCALPLGAAPFARRFDEDERRFCCAGCLNVYAILRESGNAKPGVDLRDTDLFKRSLALGLVAGGAGLKPRPTSGAGATLRPTLVPDDAETREAVFRVQGMWCASCAWLIEQVLGAEPAVRRAEVVFAADLLKVRYAPQYLPPDRIPGTLATLGYTLSAPDDTAAEDAERRDLWLRFGIATFLWLNVMMLNLAIYIGYFRETPDSIRHTLPWLLMTLSAPAVFYCAWPVTRLALGGLRHLVVRMETLLALGIFAAWGYSVTESARGGDHIYFDTACAIVTFVLLGKVIERGARERTSRAIRVMHQSMPRKARLLVDGVERLVALDALQPGQVMLVRAGERVPADGEVASGRSHVDESLLTGEAAPAGKQPGSLVAGGSLNLDSALEIRATRTGQESALAHIVSMVEGALGRRSAIERTVDRVSRIFVPAVVVLALGTWIGWWWSGAPFGVALLRAVTVLVIACPCALGIATPLAITAAVGAASRRGVLVGHSGALETLRRVDIVVFDKTGTVTERDFTLLEVDEAALPALAALERYSEHPIGRAVVNAAEVRALRRLDASDVVVRKGEGIVGRVGGEVMAVGSRRLFASVPEALAACADAHTAEGHTVAFHGSPTEARGLLVLGQRLAPGAAAVIAALRARGIRTALVSGDAAATVAHMARTLGVDDYAAETLPHEKVAYVERLKAEGRTVAMVGDGINDAPALAVADLGVAVATGTDLAMKAAAVVLMNNDLSKLLDVLDLAERTFRVVRQNLFWAFLYNTAGLALAVTGVLHPIIAAAGMVLSSVSVVANSYRLAKGA
jgi:heavy metal translocating P-type ATPase